MQRYTKTTSRTVAWLRQTSEAERLMLAPPFQRNPVWTTKQQSSLIETILLEYPIPELYMQDLVDDAGNQQHIVVDGQQRVRAVLGFVEGDFELTDDIGAYGGLQFDDLGTDEKRKIFEYDFVVRVLPEMPPEQIRSIFQRINRTNVVLNAQELRHATYWGSFIKTIEELSDLEFWDFSGVFTANDRRRMLDAEFISELAIAWLHGLQNKKAKIDEYYQIYEAEFSEAQNLKSTFFTVLGEIEAALPDLRRTRWRKKSDFYTLFLSLAEVRDILPLSSKGRDRLRVTLLQFGDAIDTRLSGVEANLLSDMYREEAVDYADNVARAASDLNSRKHRRDALLRALGGLFALETAERPKAIPAVIPDLLNEDTGEAPATSK